MGMSTESQSSLNDSLSWDVNFYEPIQKQNDEDHEILTTLVRTSYLSHLQKSLTKNYDRWLELNKGNDDFKCCLDDIMKCATFLERKALRACMITHFYQRAMVTTMKEIKQSTEEGSLFSPLIEQLFDNKLSKTCDKEIQTNVSLLTFQVDKESHEPKEKTPPTTHYTLENSNLIIINPCNEINEKKDDLEDLFTILMTSPTYSESGGKFKLQSPKKRKYMEEPPAFDNKRREELFNSDTNSYKDSSAPVNILPPNKKERLSVESIPNEESFIEPVVENEIECPVVFQKNHEIENHKTSPKPQPEFPSIEESRKSNLDERLKALAVLFGEETPKSDGENNKSEEPVMDIVAEEENLKGTDDEPPFKYPVDWKTELAAQICNLKMILSKLPPDKLRTLHDRFKLLFGRDRCHALHTTISPNEEALCRKRTASIVVGELTPHYIGGRIGSRLVFKSLAKRITDTILLTSFVAGYEEISQIVNSCFLDGRKINSEKDVENTLI